MNMPTPENPALLIVGDCLEVLATLPDDSIDLIITSPPYLSARTYGREDIARGLEEWVAWMVKFVTIASPKCKGLIAINCEGQTRKFKYLPAPFLLAADLHRAGFNLRKPAAFDRVGIPGSGGPDWLRNDWEPIICVTRPGKLPWSDNTACGHPPKWAPGGEMSNRHADGVRINAQLSKSKIVTRRKPNGNRGEPAGTATRGSSNGDTVTEPGLYFPPVLANPGNVIEATYTACEVRQLLIACGMDSDMLPDLTKHKVGGGLMGSDLAHENEAPFPLSLPEFFVKSFCPPGGIVCDPFSGSGTSGHAALENGRLYIGIDIRESQTKLSDRRLKSGITPELFA